jgi:hypothetical protein
MLNGVDGSFAEVDFELPHPEYDDITRLNGKPTEIKKCLVKLELSLTHAS